MRKLCSTGLLLFCLGMALSACAGKDGQGDPPLINTNPGDSLTPEQNEFIESASVPLAPMSDFIDDEGNPLFSKEEIDAAAKIEHDKIKPDPKP